MKETTAAALPDAALHDTTKPTGKRGRRFLPWRSGPRAAGVGGARPMVRCAARTSVCWRVQSRRSWSHSRRRAARALSGDGPRPKLRGSQATSIPCMARSSKR